MEKSKVTKVSNKNLQKNDVPVTYKANLLKLRINPNFKTVFIYFLIFPPDLPKDNSILKQSILRSISRSIKEKFVTYITAGENLFSPTDIVEEVKFTSNLKDSIKQYDVTLKKSDAKLDLENMGCNDKFSLPIKNFIEVLIKNILQANNLMRMGKRTYFEQNSYVELDINKISKDLSLNRNISLFWLCMRGVFD